MDAFYYDLVVLPRSTTSFRVLAPAAAEPEAYLRHQVEIRDAYNQKVF